MSTTQNDGAERKTATTGEGTVSYLDAGPATGAPVVLVRGWRDTTGAAVAWALAAHHPQLCDGVAGFVVPYRTLDRGWPAMLSHVNRDVYPENRFPFYAIRLRRTYTWLQ